jgi:hypothetical protein
VCSANPWDEESDVVARLKKRVLGLVGLGGDEHVYCAACDAELGPATARSAGPVEVFTNPEGTTFGVVRFSTRHMQVRLCGTHDASASFYPGYAWAICLCPACCNQLGWHYVGEGEPFLGLIEGRFHIE